LGGEEKKVENYLIGGLYTEKLLEMWITKARIIDIIGKSIKASISKCWIAGKTIMEI
jgi:hypothetical protein